MTDSSSIENDLVSLAPTAASILGIKGSLRFRPHGSSQKAHVVLRRVEPESDSDGEGENKGVIQFSLFAYKRIEVKPGKEILLTVADGPFKDRAIIFEGDELGASSLSDAEEETQVEEDDDTTVTLEHSLPLKMRKPWAKRVEAPPSLTPVAHIKVATRQSVGVQTDLVDTVGNAISVLAPSGPALEEGSQTHSIRATKAPKVEPSPAVETTSTEVGSRAAWGHSEREPPMEVDSTSNITIPSSVDISVTIPTPHAKHDDVKLDTSTNAVASDSPERWSPSVPAPAALHAIPGTVDGNSEGADSSDPDEDQKPVIATPERPWSPSVPAALTTQGLCRRRTKDRETEKSENAKGPGQTKSTLLTEAPSSSSPTPAPPTSPSDDNVFPMKLEPTLVTALTNGGPLTAFLGKLSNHLSSDADNKMPHQTSTHRTNSYSSALTPILPPTEKPPSSPQFPQTDAALPSPHLSVDGHASPSLSVSAHSHSPGLRRDQSPSHLSPVSSRGTFSYGPLENSATNIPSHTSSPKVPPRKPQTFSWPPFRPNLDEGSTDFDPPFRAGPDFCEPPPPPPFRPTSGPATVRTFTTPTPGRQAAISSSNSIAIPPRYSPCVPPSAPGGLSSPTIQPFFPSLISLQPPLKPPQGTVLDGNYPPRQPRADAAMQAMASVSLGQGVVPRSQPQYHRQQRYNHSPCSPVDGRGWGIPMAAGTKRKASPPRAEPPASLEIPAKRSPPPTWPTVSPIRCAAVQGEHVAIQGITFNRTGKLMAVACADCTIRIWDNVMYGEVARLPHSSGVVSAQWMDDDVGLLALCADGALLRWARPAGDTPPRAHDVWNWSIIAEPAIGTLDDAPTALAYRRDRIAVSFPKFGVRIWLMKQGSWQSHRPINRQNVTALEFIDDGGVLLGGTKDGVFWHCPMPDGTLRVYNFFKARIRGIDVLPAGTHALVSQQVGRAHLVAIMQGEDYGKITQVYTVAPDLLSDAVYEANALFVGRDNAVLYGSASGYLFAWDRTSAKALYGLDHSEGCVVQAIGTYRRNAVTSEGCVVTGSRDGKLSWWAEPGGFTSNEEPPTGKRIKSS
ncbi:hypothetical protein V8E53_011765 [Lactarius tabidus]